MKADEVFKTMRAALGNTWWRARDVCWYVEDLPVPTSIGLGHWLGQRLGKAHEGLFLERREGSWSAHYRVLTLDEVLSEEVEEILGHRATWVGADRGGPPRDRHGKVVGGVS